MKFWLGFAWRLAALMTLTFILAYAAIFVVPLALAIGFGRALIGAKVRRELRQAGFKWSASGPISRSPSR